MGGHCATCDRPIAGPIVMVGAVTTERVNGYFEVTPTGEFRSYHPQCAPSHEAET